MDPATWSDHAPVDAPSSELLSSSAYPTGYGPPPNVVPPAGLGPPPGFSQIPVSNRPTANVFPDPYLGLALAPWWKRFLAIMIDWAIIGATVFVLLAVIGAATKSGQSSNANQQHQGGAVFLGLLVLMVFASIPGALYFGFLNGSQKGQTVGKMALGIAVRDRRTGGKIGFWRALGRSLIMTVFYVVFVVPYLIDNLSPLWDKRRQAWHDKVAGSIVIDLKP